MEEKSKNAELESLYAKRSTMDVIRMMNDLKRRKEEAEEKLSHINLHYDYIRYNMIPQRFDDEGIKNTVIEGIGRISLSSGLYASVKPDSKEKAYNFLRDTGHGDIVKETINTQTLAATVKAMMQKGEEVPEDMFTVTPWTRASITKV